MEYDIDPIKSTKVEIDRDIANRCIALLSTFEDISNVELRPTEAGVWNNIVLEVITPQETYFYKQYREFSNIQNYSPPSISATHRAQVAQTAQKIATESFVDGYRLVPQVLAANDTEFIMEAIPYAKSMFSYLSTGTDLDCITSTLPTALAKFHNSTLNKFDATTILSDNRFRDYKLDLQYLNVAELLNPTKGQILRDFAEWYKQRGVCVTHGDFNSKNILISSDGKAYVIDFEQAHLGTPAYDLAFILSELFIAELQHEQNPAFHNLSRLFVERYLEKLNGYDILSVAKETTMHLAAQIMYRFNGPSHAVWTSYVNDKVREEALKSAASFVTTTPQEITSIL